MKPGAGDGHALDIVEGAQPHRDQLGKRARIGAGGLGQHHRGIGRHVAMAGVAGRLDGDGFAIKAGGQFARDDHRVEHGVQRNGITGEDTHRTVTILSAVAARRQGNAVVRPPRKALAGDVVAKLVLGQVEAHEQLEAASLDGILDARLGQRIVRGFLAAGLARPVDQLLDVGRQRGRALLDRGGRRGIGLRAQRAVAKCSWTLPTRLATTVAAPRTTVEK